MRPKGARQPAGTRPGAGSAGRTESGPGGSRAGTGRPLWVLGAVGVLLAVLILPYFQKWLVQRSEIQSARAAVSQSQQDVARLREQRARWADDEYVKAQARARLHYVMPGESGFVLVDPEPKATASPGPTVSGVRLPAGNRPWYSDLLISAQVAAAPDGP